MTPAERMRAWRAANPEKAKAANKRSRERRDKEKDAAYREAHREEMREYQRQYYQEHREKILARTKKYQQEHPEQCREYSARHAAVHPEVAKAYREAHKEEKLISKRDWHRRNPEKYAVYYHNWRLNGPGGSYYRAWRERGCVVCGENDWRIVQAHHVNPAEKETPFNKIYSLKKMEAELAKCIPLCANHHILVHHEMRNGGSELTIEEIIATLRSA